MANKRIRKKQLTRREASLSRASGKSDSLYSPRTILVAVPCPRCAKTTLHRTYIPALGTMNGTVHCSRCRYEGSYMSSLANAMTASDPLPSQLSSASEMTLQSLKERRRVPRLQKPSGWASLAGFVVVLGSYFSAWMRPRSIRIALPSRGGPQWAHTARAAGRRLVSVFTRP
jgi:hypothetical protein